MAMTQYNGDPEVISKLGTTPQERGLTTEQFKAKFDEGLKAFVTWFNDTHKTEFDAKAEQSALDAHLADVVTEATANKIPKRNALGFLFSKNAASTVNGVWATSDRKETGVISAGGTLVSNITLNIGISFLVFASLQTGAQVGQQGLYFGIRFGDTLLLSTIVSASLISISMDSSYHLVATYAASGTAKMTIITL